MRRWKVMCVVSTMAVCGGCSASGVVESSDPNVKLQQAEELYDHEGRYVPAERLMKEALATFEKNGDQSGIAETYRQFGFLYRADVSRTRALVPDDFDQNRYATSTKYFDQAAALLERLGDYASLSNVYFDLGQNYFLFFNDRTKACDYFERSRSAAHEAMQQHPDRKMVLPSGAKTFDEFIDAAKQQFHCV